MKYALIAVVLVLLCNARRLARCEEALSRAHPGRVALVLAALAVAVRTFYFVRHGHDLTFDGHMVRGAPFSDGAGWHSLARDFSLGQRHDSSWISWTARRPLYYLFMGSVYALTGASIAAAQWTHILLSTLSVVLIFDLIRRNGPMLIAVAVAGFFAFDRWDIRMNLSTVTETLGSCGTAVSLWLLMLAVDKTLRRDPGVDAQRSRDIALLWALSGMSLALANLARPFTLPAAATLSLVPLVLCAHARPRCRWSTPARLIAVYGLAVALTLAPWIVRQYVRHGITELSENGGEMLYAATSPEHGTWSGEISRLASHTRSIRERVDFYKQGIGDNLRQHPGFYVTNSIQSARANLRGLAIGERACLGLLLLTFAVVLARLRLEQSAVRWGPAIAILVAVLWLTAKEAWLAQLALLVLALGWGAARRPALLVLALFTATCFVLLGLLALPASGATRFNYGLRGFHLATVWWSAWELFTATARARVLRGHGSRHSLEPAPPRRTWGRAPIPLGMAAAACLALLLIGCARAVLRYAAHPAATAPLTERVKDPEPYRRAVLEHPGYDSWRPWSDRFEVYRTRLIEDYLYRFEADDGIRHWYEGFAPRPYPFTVMRTADGAKYVSAAGTALDARLLRGDQDAIVIGLEVPTSSASRESIFEVLAFALLGEPAEILTPAPELLASHSAHLQQRL